MRARTRSVEVWALVVTLCLLLAGCDIDPASSSMPPAADPPSGPATTESVDSMGAAIEAQGEQVDDEQERVAGTGGNAAPSDAAEESADGDVPSEGSAAAAGAPCPEELHDAHTATAPNGRTYHTWHAVEDPASGCLHDHDHGTDPSLLPGNHTVTYGYMADVMDSDEPTNGFKNFGMQGSNGTWWLFTVHNQTSSDRRICMPLHTVKVKVVADDGALLADLQFKGHFGAAKNEEMQLLADAACGEDQAEIAATTASTREFPVVGSGPGNSNLEQEAWRLVMGQGAQTLTGQALGLRSGVSFYWRFPERQLANDDGTAGTVATGGSGSERYVLMPAGQGTFEDFGADVRADLAGAQGTFCTDELGNEVLDLAYEDCGAPGSNTVQQFIQPGLNASVDGGDADGACVGYDAGPEGLYHCGEIPAVQIFNNIVPHEHADALTDN